MAHRKNALGIEKPVGDHPHEERGNQGSPRHRAIGRADLNTIKGHAIEVRSQRYEPGSPDEKLEKHHYRKL